MNYRYYRDATGKILAFAADGSQDIHMPPDLAPLSSEEAAPVLAALNPTPIGNSGPIAQPWDDAVIAGGPNPDGKRVSINGCVIRNDGPLGLRVGSVTGVNPAAGMVVTGTTSGAVGTANNYADGVITLNAQLKLFFQNGETITWAGGSAPLVSQKLWENIEDNNHISRGFGPVDGTSFPYLLIPRLVEAHKNVSTIVGVDETYARMGVWVGASSNLNDIRIYGSMPASLKFAATTTPTLIASQHNTYFMHDVDVHWTLATYTLSGISGTFAVGEIVTVGAQSAVVSYVNGSRLDIRGRNSAGYVTLGASGTITGATSGATATITSETILKCWTMFHPNSYTNNTPSVSYSFGSGAASNPQTLVQIAPERVSGKETRFYPFGQLETRIHWNGSAWLTVGGADRERNGGNGWVMAWSGDHLLVKHPPVQSGLDVQISPYGAAAYSDILIADATDNSFKVYFRAQSGSPVTTPDVNMSFLVNRGVMQLYNPWTGHVSVNFPCLELDLRRLNNPNANFWVISTVEEKQ